MKKYTIWGPAGISATTGFENYSILSGSITSLTGAAGNTIVLTPWISTHFGGDEVACVIMWEANVYTLLGPSLNLTVQWFGSWSNTFNSVGSSFTSSTVGMDSLQSMIFGGQGASWQDGPVTIASAGGATSRTYGGLTFGGVAPSAAMFPGSVPLPPFVRAAVDFKDYSGGTFQLNCGLYGNK